MAQARDEAGNIWEVDEAGNAIRLIQAAQAPQAQGVVMRNPTAQAREERADKADVRADRADSRADTSLAITAANAARADANSARAAEAEAVRLRLAEEAAARSAREAERGSVAQNKDASFLRRALNAEKTISQLPNLPARSLPGQFASDNWPNIYNMLSSEDRQKFNQAEREFIQAYLRDDSGAAIPDSEIISGGQTYFPRPGDTPAVVAQKAAARRALMEGMLQSSGPAGIRVLEEVGGWPSEPSSNAQPVSAVNENAVGAIGPKLTAAEAGSDTRGVPIPDEYQAAHTKYLRDNWGRIDPEAYAQFRQMMDERFGFSPDIEAYRAVVPALNARAGQAGVRPEQYTIGPVEQRMTEGEQFRNDLVSGPGGALSAGFANAVGLGIPSMLASEQFNALREDSPWWMLGGEIPGAFAGTGLASAGLGQVAGRVANPTVASVLSNPMTADAAYGAAYGATQADNPLAGAAVGGGSALLGNRVGSWIGGKIGGRQAARQDTRNAGEQSVASALAGTDINDITGGLRQAQSMGVPAMAADLSPELNTLGGVAIRSNPTVAGNVRNTLGERSAGQYDRLLDATGHNLGPVENIPVLSEKLMKQASRDADPLYVEAYAAPGAADLDIADLLARPSMQAALPGAVRIAREADRNPYELGFVFDEAGVPSLSDAGRFIDPLGGKPQSPNSVLREMGVNAPDDLVSFARRNGGLVDDGGELSFIGANNAARRGTPLAGGDSAAGRLVNPNGRTLDEMAELAWEAGYFGPAEITPRPTTREFMEALEDTYTGNNRVFSTYDDDVLSRYFNARDASDEWARDSGQFVADTAIPVGPDVPFAPIDSYGSVQGVGPTWETMDYLKRGLDDVVEGRRDSITRKLDTEGRAINNTLREFLSRVDAANPAYAAARKAYAGPAQAREAMEFGYNSLRADPNTLGRDFAKMGESSQAQARLGFQSAIADRAAGVRDASNPFDALFGNPAARSRVETLYGNNPEGVANILAQADLERQLAQSSNRLIGNSATAERMAADEAFNAANSGIGDDLTFAAIEAAASGGLPIASGARALFRRSAGNKMSDKKVAANAQRAEEIAPLILNTDTAATIEALESLAARTAEQEELVKALTSQRSLQGARIGGVGGASVAGALLGQ